MNKLLIIIALLLCITGCDNRIKSTVGTYTVICSGKEYVTVEFEINGGVIHFKQGLMDVYSSNFTVHPMN